VSPTPAQLSISGNFVGMAAVSNTLFLLLAGGAIESLQVAPTSQPLAVLAQQPIAAPLPNSDVPFDPSKTTISVPVPQNVAVPQQQHQPQFLTVAGATALSAADINGTAHLYISDPVNHRILDLTLGQQIASPNGVASTQSTPTGRAKTPSPTPRGTSTPAATTTNLTLQLFQQVVSSAYFNQMMGVAVDPRGTAVSVLVQVPNSSSNIDLISLSTGQQTNCMTQTAS
jgi:hypothetical protein